MTELRGIFAALTTPLDGEAIDESGYFDHIDALIEAGVHGLVLCSGTGEYAYLTPQERRWLIEAGARHVDGRVPTIAQATELATATVVDNARAAQDAGASAVMVMPPYLEPPGPDGVFAHYAAVAGAVGIPVVMYNVPAQAAPLTPDLYRRLLAVPGLDYVKDSSGDITVLQDFLRIGGKVLCGIDAYAPYALMEGAVGMIWGAVNFMPAACARLFDLIAAGEHSAALALWDHMRPVCLWLLNNDHDVDYLTGVKAATSLSGRPMGGHRAPLQAPGPAAMRELAEAMEHLPGTQELAA